jgi:hypothetical protein
MNIDYHHGTFSAFVVGGDKRLEEFGWAFGFHSGLPCTYYTRSCAAVTRAVEIGYELSPDAISARYGHVDDEQWAKDYDAERVAKNAAENERRRLILLVNDSLVAQAKAKLTPEEFDAVLAEGAE